MFRIMWGRPCIHAASRDLVDGIIGSSATLPALESFGIIRRLIPISWQNSTIIVTRVHSDLTSPSILTASRRVEP